MSQSANRTDIGQVYSSAQWFTSLDTILERAIEYMIERTHLVEHYVSQAVNYQNTYKKRHVSSRGNWQSSISAMIEFLAEPTLARFRAIGFDRGFVFAMLQDFDRLVEGYTAIYIEAFRSTEARVTQVGVTLNEYHARVGLRNGRDILQLVSHVNYLYREAVRLKNMIIANYESYIRALARYDSKHHPLPVDYDDMCQGYFIAANKAINHFNLEKGSFKSYLDIWIKKSRNGDHHFYGSAYTVPSGVKANHLYVPLDSVIDLSAGEDDSPYDIVNKQQEANIVLALARMVDPEGYAVQALQLGER